MPLCAAHLWPRAWQEPLAQWPAVWHSLPRPPNRRRPTKMAYKLWLRYASPGEIAENYRQLIRQVVVPSKSATGQIIRDELSAA